MRAVIYCRVSTTEQAQNLSLPTQEQACREYCAKNDYDVDRVFVDAGESAKTTDRPAFLELLAYCRQRRGRVHAVIVYSLTRFSRNSANHHAIAGLLRGSGVMLRSVTEPIDDSPTGRLMETMLAGFAQFDNDVKAERTKVGMRASIQRGRWMWQAPLGYLKGARGGPSLVIDPDTAPAIRRAFELVAAGELTGQPLIRELQARGLRTVKGQPLGHTRLYQILKSPVYAGRVEGFGIAAAGDFEPIIDDELFARVQQRLAVKPSRRGARAQVNHPDFPLRRFVRCAICGRALSGGWSAGRNRKYAYYQCVRGCTRVTKAALEEEFLQLLDRAMPTPGYVRLLTGTIMASLQDDERDGSRRHGQATARLNTLKGQLAQLEKSFIFERRVDDMSYRQQRDELREMITLATIDVRDLELLHAETESTLALAEHLLTHASALWTSATDVEERISIQQKLFPEGLTWKSAPARDKSQRFEVPLGFERAGAFVNPRTCLHVYNLDGLKEKSAGLASPTGLSMNRIMGWLQHMRVTKAA